MTPADLRAATAAAVTAAVAGEAAAERGGTQRGGNSRAHDPAAGGGRLEVRGADVAAAFGCAAAAALDGESPFVASATLAGWSAGATVLDRLVHGHADPLRGRPPTDPAAAFRAAWREGEQLDEWHWRWLHGEATAGDRTLTAAEASRRVAAIARSLGTGAWPPTSASHVGLRLRWNAPGGAVRLHGRLDLVLGRRDGTHRLVVALGGDHGPATRARLAYEALVDALTLGRPAAAVVGVLPDAGRRLRLEVDDALLDEGIDAAARATALVAARRRLDPTGQPRRPGPRCRTCPHAATCAEGTTWLAGPGRRRHGFLPPADDLEAAS